MIGKLIFIGVPFFLLGLFVGGFSLVSSFNVNYGEDDLGDFFEFDVLLPDEILAEILSKSFIVNSEVGDSSLKFWYEGVSSRYIDEYLGSLQRKIRLNKDSMVIFNSYEYPSLCLPNYNEDWDLIGKGGLYLVNGVLVIKEGDFKC